MGVKHLNTYFLANAASTSIEKKSFEYFRGKTIVIDTSIYLYKFLSKSKDSYMEQLYLFLTLIHRYGIHPIFIFDGKTPPEKKALVRERYTKKKEAESRYDELQIQLLECEKGSQEFINICKELEELRKKMARLRNEHFIQAKQLMDAFSFPYYDALGEADQLCVYFVQSGKAWACLSDDMDMFLLGCPRVLRSISLLNNTWMLYDTFAILSDLNIQLEDLIEIVILSGSDYSNSNEKKSLTKLLEIYNTEYNPNKNTETFYEWYSKTYNTINENMPTEKLLFDISTMMDKLEPFSKIVIPSGKIHMSSIQNIMSTHGFVFV